MAECFLAQSGGGGGLNFKVVGGTSTPASPKENTIWVNTSTTITSYVFSATQPTAASGKVWITIGTSSTIAFNALKKNGIQVYPISAKQYVSGAWVDKTAKSWQGGAWVDWIRYLYCKGNEFEEVTGGWKSACTSGHASNPKNTEDGLYVKKTSAQGAYIHNWYTNNMIDVTNISIIHAKVISTVAIDNWFRLCLHSNNTSLDNEKVAFTQIQYVTANKEIQIDLDVDTYSGTYYIKLNHQGGSNAEVFWKEVWYE